MVRGARVNSLRRRAHLIPKKECLFLWQISNFNSRLKGGWTVNHLIGEEEEMKGVESRFAD